MSLIPLAWLVLALPAFAVDGTALLQPLDRKMEPGSYEMVRKLVNIEPDGSRKEFVLYSVRCGAFVDVLRADHRSAPVQAGRLLLRAHAPAGR